MTWHQKLCLCFCQYGHDPLIPFVVLLHQCKAQHFRSRMSHWRITRTRTQTYIQISVNWTEDEDKVFGFCAMCRFSTLTLPPCPHLIFPFHVILALTWLLRLYVVGLDRIDDADGTWKKVFIRYREDFFVFCTDTRRGS